MYLYYIYRKIRVRVYEKRTDLGEINIGRTEIRVSTQQNQRKKIKQEKKNYPNQGYGQGLFETTDIYIGKLGLGFIRISKDKEETTDIRIDCIHTYIYRERGDLQIDLNMVGER